MGSTLAVVIVMFLSIVDVCREALIFAGVCCRCVMNLTLFVCGQLAGIEALWVGGQVSQSHAQSAAEDGHQAGNVQSGKRAHLPSVTKHQLKHFRSPRS